jgi:hypothetical protein
MGMGGTLTIVMGMPMLAMIMTFDRRLALTASANRTHNKHLKK